MRLIKILPFLFLFPLFSSSASADFAENSFITIVNPVRISANSKDPKGSLLAEYEQVKKFSFPATWLFTYDVLKNKDIVELTKSMDDKQEFGIFLEVSPDFARASSVSYNLRDSWHRAASVFLSGYIQEDRRKLIDNVFAEFKSKFGSYPKSVGSWWTDAYSLNYLQKKYGVIANLSISDQFSLDEYTVWGSHWSLPYFPSKINAAIPPQDEKDKIPLVMLRWAARDPLNGYKSPSKYAPALFSVQDYSTAGLNDDYFEKLSMFYAKKAEHNDFGHLTLGLEGDFPPSVYSQEYARRLAVVRRLNETGIKVLSMKDFAKWYLDSFKNLNPSSVLVSDDILSSKNKSIWFQNPFYRIGMVYDPEAEKIAVRDLRVYNTDLEEPFLKSVNRQNGLFISLPYVIDSVIDPNTEWVLSCGELLLNGRDKEVYFLNFTNCQVKFLERSIEIRGNIEAPKRLISDPSIDFKKRGNGFDIYVKDKWIVSSQGLNLDVVNIRIPFGLKRRLPNFIIDFLPLLTLLASGLILLIFIILAKILKRQFIILCLLTLGLIIIFPSILKQKLYVSQSEFQALKFLRNMPSGNVLVYDRDCSRCIWRSPYKPAAMVGYKKYIEKIGQKKIIQSLKFSLAQSPEAINSEIKKTNARYIYFAKYEDYIEILSYPPENINSKLRKIFENANAQIWEIEK